MTNRSNHLASYTFLIGLLFLSFLFNIHFYSRLHKIESDSVLWRCGTSQMEFQQIQNEIKRLENNPFLDLNQEKSVLKK
jgi:hypothetical protein